MKNLYVNQRRLENRTTDELIGIAKGIIADNAVNKDEATFLCQWLEENRCFADTFPFDVIFQRVDVILQDGIIDSNECTELLDLLKDLVGGNLIIENIASFASTLPLTKPCPCIEFENKNFCFTGKFIYGSRNDCSKATEEKGAFAQDSINKKLDYLVIGSIGSVDWKHSTFGKKILKAIEYNNGGTQIGIISEDDWINAVVQQG